MSRRLEAERNDRALLDAAREVLAEEGAHASVAAVAARAGVGIGSLYRRWRSKQELFQHLCEVALDQWLAAAEEALAHPDPWAGLVHYVTTCVDFGPGSLAPIAGTVEITAGMDEKMRRSDEAQEALVDRAREAGALRADVTSVDLSLLLEQLGRSPLLDQLRRQGRRDLLPEATAARDRLVAIVLAGLRPAAEPLPGSPPDNRLLTDRWETR